MYAAPEDKNQVRSVKFILALITNSILGLGIIRPLRRFPKPTTMTRVLGCCLGIIRGRVKRLGFACCYVLIGIKDLEIPPAKPI